METKNKIYARVIPSDEGTYTNEDGTRCTLDYGYIDGVSNEQHFIEMGYELFFCIPDAEKYFKLTTIEGVKKRRIVNINIYWASIVRDTAQFGQIAVAENPEFNRLADCLFRALDDSFIHSATEYGVSRWEKILGITPEPGETLDDRKARILTYLNIKLPYTWRVLKQLLQTILGDDKFVLDYVNDECKLIVHTDRVSEQKLQLVRDLLDKVLPLNLVVEMYNHTIDITWKEINKYANCKNEKDFVALCGDANVNVGSWVVDITPDGEWCYKLTSLISGIYIFSRHEAIKNKLRFFTTPEAPVMWQGASWYGGMFYKMKNLEECHCSFPALRIAESAAGMFQACEKLWFVKHGFPSLEAGNNMFADCILDKGSALRVLTSIPTWTSGTHLLTIGIHVDHKTDVEVLAAIENAKKKGWTLTVQWNGTPTVRTYGLRQPAVEIYAKVTESKYGEYIDENGTRCTFDWGHLIVSPDGKTPSEMGYKLFFSLDEAEEYFKLTKEGTEND